MSTSVAGSGTTGGRMPVTVISAFSISTECGPRTIVCHYPRE